MEDGDRRNAYDVQLILRGGATRVYQSYDERNDDDEAFDDHFVLGSLA